MNHFALPSASELPQTLPLMLLRRTGHPLEVEDLTSQDMHGKSSDQLPVEQFRMVEVGVYTSPPCGKEATSKQHRLSTCAQAQLFRALRGEGDMSNNINNS